MLHSNLLLFLSKGNQQSLETVIFFPTSQDDLLVNLRETLHRPLSSLTTDVSDVTDKLSVPRVPEICFMSDDSSPDSMSSWLDNKFTADTASPLLRCDSCKLLVHASKLIPISAGVSVIPVLLLVCHRKCVCCSILLRYLMLTLCTVVLDKTDYNRRALIFVGEHTSR